MRHPGKMSFSSHSATARMGAILHYIIHVCPDVYSTSPAISTATFNLNHLSRQLLSVHCRTAGRRFLSYSLDKRKREVYRATAVAEMPHTMTETIKRDLVIRKNCTCTLAPLARAHSKFEWGALWSAASNVATAILR